MKLKSLTIENEELVPIEIELALWPGLPEIKITGLPDQNLKESVQRIKSALRSSGYDFPVAQQILVNLKPSHLRKSSPGIELAIAMAYLLETQQIPEILVHSHLYFYGELSLTGEVIQPENLKTHFFPEHPCSVITGQSETSEVPFGIYELVNLKEVDLRLSKNPQIEIKTERPLNELPLRFSKEQTELLKILAVGEHSALLAGAAGSGKSTLAQNLVSFLESPSSQELTEIQKNHKSRSLKWRPVMKPHHSTPLKSMIGGGSSPQSGVITRAHLGVLILDELLEFSPHVQESLREPFEDKKITVSRLSGHETFKARCQIVGTTNLCPCGDWTPNKKINCNKSLKKCRSYSEKLSGPLVDRFDFIYFSDRMTEMSDSTSIELLSEIEKVRAWKIEKRPGQLVPNSQISINDLENGILKKLGFWALPSELKSQRRRQAILRLSRTLADLEFKEDVNQTHINRAVEWSFNNFHKLKTIALV